MATYTPPRGASPGGRPPVGNPRARGDYPPPRTPQDRAATPGRTMPPPAREMPPRRPARPRPKDPGARPVSAPRHTRPLTGPGTKPATKPATKPTGKPSTRPSVRPAAARTRPRHPRAPFILLLVGLLGGALVSLLVISTTLAQGSYRISNLQQQNANLAKQESTLTQQVAQASSPAQIAQEAEQFGMRPNPALQFINLKTGKVVKGQVSKADAEINVPGYNP
jgi:hypothetical protein